MKAITRTSVVCALAAVVSIGHVSIARAQLSGSDVQRMVQTFRVSMGPVVRSAPYSGEGTTTVTQVLSDGTRIEQTTTARVYRDAAGRERREQTIIGLGMLNPASQSGATVTIVDPDAGVMYTLDPKTRTARKSASLFAARSGPGNQAGVMIYMRSGPAGDGPVTARSGPPPPPPPPPPPGEIQLEGSGAMQAQSLGTRQIEGVTATGTMMKSTIVVGQIGNDRPIEITDEQWTSTDLKVLVISRHHDPRTGDVEYRLTNIVRGDPPADLFVVPPDYTVLEPPPPPPPPPAPRGRQ